MNVYEGGEVDVYIVDSTIAGNEKPSVVMLSTSPFVVIAGTATAGAAGPTIQTERVETREEGHARE